ncbi:MAG: dihydropteroate synthase [Paracoccaceae bacterium]
MADTHYYRALLQTGTARPEQAVSALGSQFWYTHAEVLSRGAPAHVIAAQDVPDHWQTRIGAPRASIVGLDFSAPVIMGILNVTPDSFSDGGDNAVQSVALTHANAMMTSGAHILDIGGESTRPGAKIVPVQDEISRTAPVIQAIRKAGQDAPISIDTRKADVAQAALRAGANLVNDVSGFTFDPALAKLCAAQGVPVCVMHALGDPTTMQDNPRYDDVLLDVFDFLAERIAILEDLGVPRTQIIADPGIGFGKTQAHNLTLLNRVGFFHGLGVPILLGASRKRFIGTLGHAPDARTRAPGSIAVALAALAQGVQIVRVHDVSETAQAIALWQAVTTE